MWPILITIALLLLIYKLITWNHAIFEYMGVPAGPKPWPLVGNFLHMVKHGATKDDELVKKYGKIYGYFEGMIPVLVVADADYIKMITVKHFDKFVNRRMLIQQKELASSVTVLRDDEWRTVRNVITPTFTSGKLKKIAIGIDDCAHRLLKKLRKTIETNPEIETRTEIGTFTMSVVAEILFGIKIDDDPRKSQVFIEKSYKALEEFNLLHPALIALFLFPFLRPLIDRLNIGFMSKESTDFFTSQVHSILSLRRNSSKKSNDFLQLLIDARATDDSNNNSLERDSASYASDENGKWKNVTKRALTEEEIVSNSVLFFLAGYETTTLTAAWMMHLLSVHQDVQEKLYNEINSKFDQAEGLSFESVSKLAYLDQVFNETLRLYPAALRTDRISEADCVIGSYKIPKDMVINISIQAVHYDEEYWPEPKKFDPERFCPERKHEIRPYSYLPFGVGPRNCIGMRLAILEAKICIIRLLQEFQIARCEKTEEFPKLKTNIGLAIPAGALWVRLIKRN